MSNYGRTSLKGGMGTVLAQMGGSNDEAKKAIRQAQVQELYKGAIKHVYKDSAFFVLEKTNAVYILEEPDKGMRRKARFDDKMIKRMIIYTCDSMVHADLDSKQEFIKMWLGRHGELIDKFELLSARLGMRKKFPYAKTVEETKKGLTDKFDFLKETEVKEEVPEEAFSALDQIENPKLKAAILANLKSS